MSSVTVALVLAQMMDRGDMNDGGGHWWGWLIGLGVFALVIVLVVWVVTRLTQPHSAPASHASALAAFG